MCNRGKLHFLQRADVVNRHLNTRIAGISLREYQLTHLPVVSHICVNRVSRGYGNGLSPIRRHAMHLKISAVKWRPFCPGGDVLKCHKVTQPYSSRQGTSELLRDSICCRHFMSLTFALLTATHVMPRYVLLLSCLISCTPEDLKMILVNTKRTPCIVFIFCAWQPAME